MDRKKTIDRLHTKLTLKNTKLSKSYLNTLNSNEAKVVNFPLIR